ncbi:MAG: hypothetical protein WB643_03595 [Candidatus Bathyarchaeia archaeon]
MSIMHYGVIRTKPAITHSPMVHTSRALFDKSVANKVRFGMTDSVFGELKISLERSSRDSGLGVPTLDEKSKGWLKAIERRREQVERLGIPIPAIREIDLEGAEVDVRKDEPIATPF